MPQGWVFVVSAFLYIGLLFAVASWGDRVKARRGRPSLYALSLAVYCTSWTFLGSVGLAARSGLDFLTIYIGPMLMFGLGAALVGRVVRLAKSQNITSIADFIAARYGKSQAVAAAVSLIAIIGTVPYIALQLKAVSSSLTTVVARDLTGTVAAPLFSDIALTVTLAMAVFAVLFGTRHTDATEHQEGLMLAIALESAVKLATFLVVGGFVVFVMFDGFPDLWRQAEAAGATAAVVRAIDIPTWITMILLSFVCGLLLPRQFHVAVVECGNPMEVRRAAWLFPLYLVLINLFVVPVALAGLVLFPAGAASGDLFMLALPISSGAPMMTVLAFIGGLSAATAMVIVESVALAIMASNDILIPLILRRRGAAGADRADMGRLILNLRRASILAILLLAYAYHRATTGASAALADIGLLSFAAIAQFAPAFFGGLIWREATAAGALAGMLTGFVVWAYTLLLPTFAVAGLLPDAFLNKGLFGLDILKPQNLLFTDMAPLVHAVFWSLFFNVLVYIVVSLLRRPTAIERVQASLFVRVERPPLPPGLRLWRSAVSVEELRMTLVRYLGEERTARAFTDYAAARTPLRPAAEADASLLQYTERLLASAIGAASSRVVLSMLMSRRNVSRKAALKLLDDASAAFEYNRDLLQTALDHVRQGIAVFDAEMRLICWNRQFRDLLDLSDDLAEVGTPLSQIIRFMAERGDFGSGSIEAQVARRVEQVAVRLETFQERFGPSGMVLEVRTARLPHGGLVATYTDITEKVRAADALELANETLERRVRERTEELTRLNLALERARAEAEEANISKTRFLAAAGHDILQPLSAARLYSVALTEESVATRGAELARNIDSSLEAVEEILSALLEISRLDSGVLEPEISVFPMEALFRRIRVEFAPMAAAKGLRFDVVECGMSVRSDRRLLLRVLRNLVSNGVKYTASGRVLIGCRRCGDQVRIGVLDSGSGIPASQHRLIFEEFQRLEAGARAARGLGLGLSIVDRITRRLGVRIDLRSQPGRGSAFWVEVPLAQPERPVEGLGELSVVCIDNDPKILESMTGVLRGWGVQVLGGANLAEIADCIESFGADGLLVDYHLDQGDGIAATQALRRVLGRDVPGALITGDPSPEVRRAARGEGLTVLTKPLKPAQLRALLLTWKKPYPQARGRSRRSVSMP